MLDKSKLDPAEKADMRRVVQTYMQAHPVRERQYIRQLWQGLFLSFSKSMVIALVLAVSLALGGGVSYAAEQALPGDALYVVKTAVNEPVLEALTVSAQGKAEWESRRVERRLEEAETLANEGRLSEDLRLAIEEQLQTRIDDVKLRIKKFQDLQDLGAAAEVSARLEVALRAHDQILEKLTLKLDNQTKVLREKVKKEHEESQDEADDADDAEEQDVDEDEDADRKKSAAEGKRKAAENKIAEVASFMMKAKISEETRLEADARLKKVDEAMMAAQKLFDAGDYEAAFTAFRDAHRSAQEVKVFIAAEHATTVRVELRAEVREEKQEDKDEKREERRDDDEDNDEQEDEDDDEDEDDERESKKLRSGIRIEVGD